MWPGWESTSDGTHRTDRSGILRSADRHVRALPVLWLSDLVLFFTGAALIIVFATVTSLVQLVVPNELRGRVMSIYMVAFRGGMPLGSLVSGYFASKLGAPVVLICNGILLVAVATYFLVRSHGVREL